MKKRYSIYVKQIPIREKETKSYSRLQPTRTWNVVERLNYQILPDAIGFLTPSYYEEDEDNFYAKRRLLKRH